jgi:WD40 repeat protein
MHGTKLTVATAVLVGLFGVGIDSPTHGQDKEKAAPQAPMPVRTDLYGDPLPLGALQRLGTVRLLHNRDADFVCFAPDGKTLASATGHGGPCRLWDVATGQQLREMRLAHWVAPDWKIWASADNQGTIHLWDGATDQEIRQLRGHAAKQAPVVFSVCFSPDGRTLVSGGRDKTLLWDVATGKVIHPLESGQISWRVRFSPDGKTVAALSGATGPGIPLWDVVTGKLIRELKAHEPARVLAICFSPDSKVLADASTVTKTNEAVIRLWDVATGKLIRELPGGGYGSLALSFAPDGRSLASGTYGGVIRIWDVATGQVIRQPKGHRAQYHHGWVNSLCFASDGQTLASAGGDGTIRLWDTKSGEEIDLRPRHTAEVHTVAVAPDGKTLVSAGNDETVRLWDLATSKEIRPLTGFQHGPNAYSFTNSIGWSPDGRSLAVACKDSTVRLWDLAAGKEMRQLQGFQFNNGVHEVCFAPDGRTLVAHASGGVLQFWDVATGKELHRCAGRACCFAPDGRTLAFCAGSIQLWDLTSGKEIGSIQGHPDFFHAMHYASDGETLISLDRRGIIRHWSTANRKLMRELPKTKSPQPMRISVEDVCFAPDGKTVALAFMGDDLVRLWETATGKEIGLFQGNAGGMRSAAFTPDGLNLIVGYTNGTILVWDVTGQRPTGRFVAQQLSPQQQDSLWVDLAGGDATKANRALWTLVTAPQQAIPLLEKQLPPAARPDPQKLAQWLADLDSEQFAVRENAMEELAKLEGAAEPTLRKRLAERPALEVQQRIEQLLTRLEPSPPETIRIGRALSVLEHIGSTDARRVLETLAKGAPGARLTKEAQAALDRLNRRMR